MFLMDIIRPIKRFAEYPPAPGILLGLAALFSLILVNSPFSATYDGLLDTVFAIQLGELKLSKPLLLWINDGLMAIFFLLVGLEVKREIIDGELSSVQRCSLPAIAACGGLLVPAMIYMAFNWHDPVATNGWAIPAATDIAFAYGVMLLLGDRVPRALKVALVAIAVIDDIAAIIIIALFYTTELSYISLYVAVGAIVALITLNRHRVTSIGPYVIIGIILWVSVLKSGVHATLAGVVLGLIIPYKVKEEGQKYSPAESLEHALHPWVNFGVLPIFAFANAGVSLAGLTMDAMTNTITMGIFFGLLFGKQLGVMLFSWLAINGRLCALPDGVNWVQYYALAILTGIGFTMSFFIGTLAFSSAEDLEAVRLGVLSASAICGGVGYLLLRRTCQKKSG